MTKVIPATRSELSRAATDLYTPDALTQELMMSAQTELTFLSDRLKVLGRELEELKDSKPAPGKAKGKAYLNRKEKLKRRIRESKLRRERVLMESNRLASAENCFVERIKNAIDPELFALTMRLARQDEQYIRSNISIPENLQDSMPTDG